MGFTTWASTASAATYGDYSRKLRDAGTTARDIFTRSGMNPDFDPSKIALRESRDSELNPSSTPIILGLDVTGSMGFIPEYLVKEGFGPLIESIIDNHPISDPHVMMMAVGDLSCDSSPLQATQFETDVRLVEQLTQLYLERGGGGNDFESYDLPWCFAASKCEIDSFDKRNKKGFLFTFGDEPPPEAQHKYGKHIFDQCLGVGAFQTVPSTIESLQAAMQRWAVFHVIVEQGSRCHNESSRRGVVKAWHKLFSEAGNEANLILLNDYHFLPQVVTAVLRVAEGADTDQVISEAGDAKDAVAHALNGVQV